MKKNRRPKTFFEMTALIANYVLLVINGCTRWTEGALYAKITSKSGKIPSKGTTFYAKIIQKQLAKFLANNILCRYRETHELVSHQCSHFKKQVTNSLDKYNI